MPFFLSLLPFFISAQHKDLGSFLTAPLADALKPAKERSGCRDRTVTT